MSTRCLAALAASFLLAACTTTDEELASSTDAVAVGYVSDACGPVDVAGDVLVYGTCHRSVAIRRFGSAVPPQVLGLWREGTTRSDFAVDESHVSWAELTTDGRVWLSVSTFDGRRFGISVAVPAGWHVQPPDRKDIVIANEHLFATIPLVGGSSLLVDAKLPIATGTEVAGHVVLLAGEERFRLERRPGAWAPGPVALVTRPRSSAGNRYRLLDGASSTPAADSSYQALLGTFDGTTLLASSCAAGSCVLARMDPASGQAQTLAQYESQLAIVAERAGILWFTSKGAAGTALYRVRRDGAEPAKLLAAGPVLDAHLSTDGTTIVYADDVALRRIPADGSAAPTVVANGLHRISASGNRLLLKSWPSGGALVTLMNDTAQQSLIVSGTSGTSALQLSADGSTLWATRACMFGELPGEEVVRLSRDAPRVVMPCIPSEGSMWSYLQPISGSSILYIGTAGLDGERRLLKLDP